MNKDLESFLNSKEGITRGAIHNYKLYLEQFLNFLNNKNVKKITFEDVMKFLESIRPKFGLSTIQQIKRYLKSFFIFHGRKDISNAIKILKLPAKLNILPIDDLKTRLEKINDPQVRAVCEFIYGTGVRRGELVNLKKGNLQWEQNKVWLISEKTREPRWTIFPSEAQKWIRIYWKCRNDNSDFVFVNKKGKKLTGFQVYYMIRKNLRVKPHTLRHSFATHLSERGASPILIKTFLGHKNIKSLEIYMHATQPMWVEALKSHPRHKINHK